MKSNAQITLNYFKINITIFLGENIDVFFLNNAYLFQLRTLIPNKLNIFSIFPFD